MAVEITPKKKKIITIKPLVLVEHVTNKQVGIALTTPSSLGVFKVAILNGNKEIQVLGEWSINTTEPFDGEVTIKN